MEENNALKSQLNSIQQLTRQLYNLTVSDSSAAAALNGNTLTGSILNGSCHSSGYAQSIHSEIGSEYSDSNNNTTATTVTTSVGSTGSPTIVSKSIGSDLNDLSSNKSISGGQISAAASRIDGGGGGGGSNNDGVDGGGGDKYAFKSYLLDYIINHILPITTVNSTETGVHSVTTVNDSGISETLDNDIIDGSVHAIQPHIENRENGSSRSRSRGQDDRREESYNVDIIEDLLEDLRKLLLVLSINGTSAAALSSSSLSSAAVASVAKQPDVDSRNRAKHIKELKDHCIQLEDQYQQCLLEKNQLRDKVSQASYLDDR